MDDSRIIDALGGTTEVARLCKVRPPSVSGWRVNGIPPARRQFLELLRPEVFACDAKDQQGKRLTGTGADVELPECCDANGRVEVGHAADPHAQGRSAA